MRRSITEAFAHDDPDCVCAGTGHVCEDHPNHPWDDGSAFVGSCPCGAPGMPCPVFMAMHA